jgi:protein TonB
MLTQGYSLVARNDQRRSEYTIYVELGFIIALSLMIVMFKVELRSGTDFKIEAIQQDAVMTEEIIQTKQEVKAPPPPKPIIPVAVSNDAVIADNMEFDLSTELDLDAALELPLGPPPAQDKKEESGEAEVFVVVERMPELIGGTNAVQQFIVYPEIARLAGIEGRVFVEFVIDERGNVVNPRIVRGIGGGCDEAALAAVKKVKFKPGMQRGKPVRVRYTLPVTFKLNAST